jgi:hypothetical protein
MQIFVRPSNYGVKNVQLEEPRSRSGRKRPRRFRILRALCVRALLRASPSGDPRPTGAPGLLTPPSSPSAVPVPIASINGRRRRLALHLGVRPRPHLFAVTAEIAETHCEKWKRVCYTPRMRDVNQNSIRFIRCIWKSTRGPAGADASSDGSSPRGLARNHAPGAAKLRHGSATATQFCAEAFFLRAFCSLLDIFFCTLRWLITRHFVFQSCFAADAVKIRILRSYLRYQGFV